MKSNATMLRLAKEKAESLGARIWKGTRCGIYLTMGELHDIYNANGFNHRGTAMRRHVEWWMACDMAVLEGSEWDAGSAVWFECPKELEVIVKVRAEECGGRFVTSIYRTEWPALRRMHGIQEELA